MYVTSISTKKRKKKKKRIKSMEKSTKDGVGRSPSNLVLGGITYQALIVSEGNTGRHHSVALLVGYYLHTIT